MCRMSIGIMDTSQEGIIMAKTNNKKPKNALDVGKYSDRNTTSLERSVEIGFGLVLGVSSAVLILLLLFFAFRSLFI